MDRDARRRQGLDTTLAVTNYHSLKKPEEQSDEKGGRCGEVRDERLPAPNSTHQTLRTNEAVVGNKRG